MRTHVEGLWPNGELSEPKALEKKSEIGIPGRCRVQRTWWRRMGMLVGNLAAAIVAAARKTAPATGIIAVNLLLAMVSQH